MPDETRQQLRERIEKQGMEMMALEIELDATKEELLQALRALDRYRQWHLQTLSQQDEE